MTMSLTEECTLNEFVIFKLGVFTELEVQNCMKNKLYNIVIYLIPNLHFCDMRIICIGIVYLWLRFATLNLRFKEQFLISHK